MTMNTINEYLVRKEALERAVALFANAGRKPPPEEVLELADKLFHFLGVEPESAPRRPTGKVEH